MTNTHACAGTVDITPETAVPLAGSEVRTELFQGVADRLEANVLVLRQAGPAIVFVSVDLIFVGQELRAGVLAGLGGAVSDQSLFFAASHTHFAPATDDRRPRLGRLDATYLEQVRERITGLVLRLLEESPTPVVIQYHRGEADHAVNRRLRIAWHLSRRGVLLGGVVAAPNLTGPRDESLHLLRFSRGDGTTMAVIWSYACHPVSFPQPLEVSADYPGRVRRRLRDDLEPALPVLFWQGFAGDIRPREMDRSSSLRSRVKRVLLGPRFGRFGVVEWNRWADSLSDRVTRLVSLSPARPVSGPIRAWRIRRPLGEFVLGGGNSQEVTFHAVMLGEEHAVVGVSAEAVAEYGAILTRLFHGLITIPVGYIDEVYGYLPTARMVKEGGYEASWFLRPFALEGPVNPEVERHSINALGELAAALATPTKANHG